MNEKNNESPRERFKRLASIRTNAVIQRLKILGNCSNRYAYEYMEDDIEKIFSAISSAVTETKRRFIIPKNTNKFKLE